MKEIKWYHFWNPKSGLVGGAIAGLIVGLILAFILFVL